MSELGIYKYIYIIIYIYYDHRLLGIILPYNIVSGYILPIIYGDI